MRDPSHRFAVASLALSVVTFAACQKSAESNADQRIVTPTPSSNVSTPAESPKEAKAPPAPPVATNKPPDKVSEENTDDLHIYSAQHLATEYAANEVTADARFKDSRLVVSGYIKRIGKDIADSPFVVLKCDGLRDVQCTFASEDSKGLIGYEPGDRTAIAGTCMGLMGNVHLDHCKLVAISLPDREGETRREYLAELAKQREQKEKYYADLESKKSERAAKEAKEASDKLAAEKAAEDAKYHKWSSASGTFTTEAKLLTYANGKITIQTREGKKVDVTLEKLSKEDQDFVAQWRRSHK